VDCLKEPHIKRQARL